MKLLASLGAFAFSASIALGWSLPTNITASHGPLANAAAAERLAAEDLRGDDLAAAPLCLTNFSKDDCQGVVEPGHYSVTGCDITGCRTIVVRGAVHEFRLDSSGLLCGGPTSPCIQRCDEFPDGRMTLKFNYVLRADSCCPYRGSWEGEWRFVADTGAIFVGTAHGTIGVGTNRSSNCQAANDDCERCYDVSLVDGRYFIGVEGSFRGESLFTTIYGPNELNFTMDSHWIVKADQPHPFRNAFRTLGRYDGVHIRKSCP
ncbi:MAG: hypothetical protein LAT64_03185 [Phycisphaerales bacterium]|nr:hypothetical protein [Planctomycetota bacterium]MCH8507760.1 hypothetical protein [Phycisphaerales bacterium]